MNIIRSGDIILKSIEKPENLKSLGKFSEYILALGETTGHKHTLVAEPTQMFEILEDEKGRKFIQMSGEGKITHQEHKEVKVMPDFYILGNEQEYNYFSQEVQRVVD